MLSVACKNDNSVCFHFLIMLPDPYFQIISGLYLSVQLLGNLTFVEFPVENNQENSIIMLAYSHVCQ